jgi:hypothetical protein
MSREISKPAKTVHAVAYNDDRSIVHYVVVTPQTVFTTGQPNLQTFTTYAAAKKEFPAID